MDDTKSFSLLIKTITRFEKETRHRLYVFIIIIIIIIIITIITIIIIIKNNNNS